MRNWLALSGRQAGALVALALVGGFILLVVLAEPPELIPNSVEREWLGDEIGDCQFRIGGTAADSIPSWQYELILRTDGCSEEHIQRSLANFSPPPGTSTPIPMTATPSSSDRCSLSPECKLDTSTAALREDYDRTNAWVIEATEGLPGKWGYYAVAEHLQLSVTWFDHDGVQLIELVTLLPSACEITTGTGLFIQKELGAVLEQVVPRPWEHDYANFLWNEACLLADYQQVSSEVHVVGDVAVEVTYLPLPSDSGLTIETMAVAMWRCGKDGATGGCKWPRP